MLKISKSRLLIASISIVIALVICFVAAPALNTAKSTTTTIVRAAVDIPAGVQINAAMLETVTVGAFNLPDNVVESPEQLDGAYALMDMRRGDYLLTSKVGKTYRYAYLSELTEGKQAVSVTIKSFAAGLSGKLANGDIVSIFAGGYGDLNETVNPPELQYVKVLAVTTAKGLDSTGTTTAGGGEQEEELPATLTLLAAPSQVQKLVDLETNGTIHTALVYRGENETAQTYLQEQENYLNSLSKQPETDTAASSADSVKPGEAQGGQADG